MKSLKQIMLEISPESQQRDLQESQRAIVKQLELQADSTFGDKTWAEASWPEFADRLISLGTRLKSGKAPQWKQDQDAAYDASEIGGRASNERS